jgi:hypothetical protein
MNENIFKKLLISTSFVFMVATGIFGVDEGEKHSHQNIVMGSQAHDEKAFVPDNLKAIEDFRQFYRQFGSGEISDAALAEHHDVFIPFAQHLLATIRSGNHGPDIQKLGNEVERYLAENTISAVWLVDTHFRYLTLLNNGDMLPAEKDVFFHVRYNKYLKALLEKDLSGKPVVTDLYKWGLSLGRKREHFYEPGTQVFFSPISIHAMKKIDKEIVKHLPSLILYPALGEAVFPVDLILNCWMDRIHIMGMPTQNVQKVHGETASPLGFAFHDLFHFKLDQRDNSLLSYIYSIVAEHVQVGGFAKDIIPHIVPLAVDKYKLIMDALKKAHESIGGDKAALAGEFTAFHEALRFPPELFSFSNPAEVLQTMLKGSLSYYEEFDSWESPDDILMTSPLTGETKMSDEDIREIAIHQALEDPELASFASIHNIYSVLDEKGQSRYVWDPEEQKAIRQEWLRKARVKVKKSPQFIDVTLKFPHGEKKTYMLPTLVRKWNNIDHSFELLKIASIEMEKPKLTGSVQEDRQIAIDLLREVRSKLTGLITVFGEKAIASFGEGEGSYTQEYQAKFNDIEARAKEGLDLAKAQN